jgi:hypothetical protein
MIKQLIKVASELDAAGFTKEADQVDAIIKKLAGKAAWSQHQCTTAGDTFKKFVMGHQAYHGGASYEDTVAYNKKKDPTFDPSKAVFNPKSGRQQMFWLLCDDTCGP